MVKSKVNKSLNNLKKSITDEIIEKIKKLELADEEEIIEKIVSEDKKPKRKAPKIPLEKQCTKLCKDGTKCRVPMCHNKICWAHMNTEQRNVYREIKQKIKKI